MTKTTKHDAVKLGVLGFPARHSLSPLIHNDWIKTYGQSGNYEAIEIDPDQFHDKMQTIKQNGAYRGFNVTLPFKQEIMSFCDHIDETALKISAVNTVVIKDDGWHGLNTDGFGFIENIRKEQPGFEFTAGPAMVLGAGGAARAVIYSLLESGVPEVRVANRTISKAEELAQDFPIKVVPWDERCVSSSDTALLVNTTSLGMKGKPPLQFEMASLSSEICVCDIVYAPLQTQLLIDAQANGNPCVTGIGMLLQQARPAFAQWFGVLPDVTDVLTNKVLEATL